LALTKLLAGVLALVLVAGMTSPAFAGVPFDCTFTEGQMINENFGLNEVVPANGLIDCNDDVQRWVSNTPGSCIDIGVVVLNVGQRNTGTGVNIEHNAVNEELGNEEGHCTIEWEVFTFSGDSVSLTQELWFNVPEEQPVAGELLPIDSSALFLAGIQSMTIWMIPTVLGLAGVGVYLVKLRANRD